MSSRNQLVDGSRRLELHMASPAPNILSEEAMNASDAKIKSDETRSDIIYTCLSVTPIIKHENTQAALNRASTPAEQQRLQREVKKSHYFRSYSPGVTEMWLRHKTKARFALLMPVIVTHRSAITRDAYDLIRTLVGGHSVSVTSCVSLFKEMNDRTYWRRRVIATLDEEEKCHTNEDPRKLFTPNDVGMVTPLERTYWRDMALMALEVDEDIALRFAEHLPVDFLALDVSRKAAKGVHVNDVKFANSTLSVMNQFGHIVLSVQCPMEGMSTGANRLALEAFAKNVKIRGQKVSLCASDKPGSDQVLREIFGIMAKGVYHFGGHIDLIDVNDSTACDEAIAELRIEITHTTRPNQTPIIGLDTEWPSDPGADPRVSLIQVGTEKRVVLVRVRRGATTVSKLPDSLVDILNDLSITKVGANIHNDVNKINREYNDIIRKRNNKFGDVTSLSRKKIPHLKDKGGYALQVIAKTVLGKTVDKTEQRSNWARSDELTRGQQLYAAADVALACLIYRRLEKQNVIFTPAMDPAYTVPDTVITPPTTDHPDREYVMPQNSNVDDNKESNIDPWGNANVQVLGRCIVAASKALATQYAKVRSRRQPLLIPATFENKDARRTLHEHVAKLGLQTRTVIRNNAKYVEVTHILSDAAATAIARDEGDQLAHTLGLSPTWQKEVNPHWMNEFVSYDSQHWLALLCNLAATKTTRLIRFFGKRLSMCLFRLAVDKDGLTDKDRLKKYLKLKLGWSDTIIENLPRSYWRSNGRCRFTRPPPADIMKALLPTVKFFSVLKDPETGMDFFGPGWRQKLRTCVDSILKGYLSDAPHLSMYTCVRVVDAEFGVYKWRCHRGSSGLEGYHQHFRIFYPSVSLCMGPRLFELRLTSFNYRWNVNRSRQYGMFCEEFQKACHYDLYLIDLAAASASRIPRYMTTPFKNHISIDCGSDITVRSGFYYVGVAARKRRGIGPPPLETRPDPTVSSLSYANWLFDGTATKCTPNGDDIKHLAAHKTLWKQPCSLQDFALCELHILADERAWSAWIIQQTEGQRVATTLAKSNWKNVFQVFFNDVIVCFVLLYDVIFYGPQWIVCQDVGGDITITPQQSVFKPSPTISPLKDTTSVLMSTSVLGPRRGVLPSLITIDSTQTTTPPVVNNIVTPTPTQTVNHDRRKTYERQRKRMRRLDPEKMRFEQMVRRSRRYCLKYTDMSKDTSDRIARLDSKHERCVAINEWLKRNRDRQTSLDEYQNFHRHTQRAIRLQNSQNRC